METEKRKRSPKELMLDYLAYGILGVVATVFIGFACGLINQVIQHTIYLYQTETYWRDGMDNSLKCFCGCFVVFALFSLFMWAADRVKLIDLDKIINEELSDQ